MAEVAKQPEQAALAPANLPTPPALPVAPPATMPINAALESPVRAFSRKALIAVMISLAAVLLVMFVYQVTRVLVIVFASTLLAVLLTTPSNLIHKYFRIPKVYALSIVLFSFVALLAGAVYFIGTTIKAQVIEVQQSFDPAFGALKDRLSQTAMGQSIVHQINALPDNIKLLYTPSVLTEQLFTTASVVGSVIVVFVVGVYLAISPETYLAGFSALFPQRSRPRVREILRAIGSTLQWWFFGQFIAMVEVFMFTIIGLKILGMKSTIALSLLAGLFNIIPNFGPILAAIPAVVLAAAPHEGHPTFDFNRAIYVVVLYSIVQALDAYIVSPWIQKRAVSLPPALIMLAQITAFLLLGPIGLVLATPILAAITVLIKMAYVEDVLGDHSMSPVTQKTR